MYYVYINCVSHTQIIDYYTEFHYSLTVVISTGKKAGQCNSVLEVTINFEGSSGSLRPSLSFPAWIGGRSRSIYE